MEGRPRTVGPLGVSLGVSLGVWVLAGLALMPVASWAAPPQVTTEPAPIHGGGPAASCEFPTAVALYEDMVLCSGTLVAPRLVLTAAHCIGGGPGPSAITFGEDIFAPARTVAVDHCLANPAATGGLGPWDFAYCLLAEPVDDVPPTPILIGCETEVLRYGQAVSIAGFGADDRDASGRKHVGETIVASEAAGDVVLVGADGTAACSGDSGGPAYVQLADGGWRAFGIVSGGVSCDASVTYVTMHSMIGWAEEQTGLDFTPCHDADGTWNPGPECGGASLAADVPAGTASWPSCVGDRIGPGSTCGPAHGSEADVEAPSVSILAPFDDQIFAEVPAELDILVEASDADGDGPASGLERVELHVDGAPAASLAVRPVLGAPPWAFAGASFPAGSWTFEARAFDWRGNEGRSAIVTIHVGEVAEDSGETSEAGETGATEDTGETDTGEPATPTQPEGCSCQTQDHSPPARSLVAIVLLSLIGLRRRLGLSRRTDRRRSAPR